MMFNLFLWENRIHPKTSKPIARRIEKMLTMYTNTVVVGLATLISRNMIRFTRSDFYQKVFIELVGSTADTQEERDQQNFEAQMIKDSLYLMAEWCFIAWRPLSEEAADLDRTKNWARSWTSDEDFESILRWIMDHNPEVCYFMDAQKDIGINKALSNLRTNSAVAQCWMDDVWYSEVPRWCE